jgi:hypothetical protein
MNQTFPFLFALLNVAFDIPPLLQPVSLSTCEVLLAKLIELFQSSPAIVNKVLFGGASASGKCNKGLFDVRFLM